MRKRAVIVVPFHVRQAVLARERFRCARCNRPLDLYPGYSLQHRRARQGTDRRPDTHTAVNLIALCGSGVSYCHGWIESHPNDARTEGMRVWQCENPAEVPVILHDGRRVLLAPDFTYAEVSTVS